MSLTPGQHLGHYEILAPLGAGGMGHVWRARDTVLHRDVAVKVLPEALAQDPERLARFTREAQTLAALNHPNISAIYAVEPGALIMELVEGEDLKGPLPVETAIACARQIADALEAAHEKGIIHRDLKPGNIRITPQGLVKLLDFGIAKVADPAPAMTGVAGLSNTNSPTISLATQAGIILGTAAYMAPEQARGRPIDKRADIWAFGVVFFEMLSGQRVFGGGETVTDTIAAVITREPDWSLLPAATPANVRRLLERCLRKDPRLRLRDIGEARIALDEPAAADPASPAAPSYRWPWIAAAACACAAFLFAGLHFRQPVDDRHPAKLAILPPEKAVFRTASLPAISADGRHVAFVATADGKNQLWVRDLDTLAARALPGTDGAGDPFWSPDSRVVAFFADGKLKRIDAAGGPVRTLCDASATASGGSWGSRDTIVFAAGRNTGLSRVAAAGGNPVPATTRDLASQEWAHRFPWFLPDGRHYLYLAVSDDADKTAVWVADTESSQRHRVLAAASNAVYAPPGYILFMRERTMMAQPFDAARATTTGDAVPIAEQIDFITRNLQGQFSISQNGTLVYAAGGAGGDPQLTWFDRTGKPAGALGPPGHTYGPSISPDGKMVAVDRLDPRSGSGDIWLYDLTRGTTARFTSHSKGYSLYPIWSPDGSQLAYISNFDGTTRLYQKAANGAGAEQVLDSTEHRRAADWSRDGRYIVEESLSSAGNNDLWVLSLSGERKASPLRHTEFRETQARLSSDGRWLAYVSDRTRSPEVYVTSFPTPGGPSQISTAGGTIPFWSRDGKELYYLAPDRKLMAVEIKAAGDRFEASVPKPLFEVRGAAVVFRFDVARDGRFLIPVEPEVTVSQPMTVVLNWPSTLK
jgi:Tol biopolymer transport system component